MENNVVTLNTAKRLKAAGFPQESLNEWVSGGRMLRHVLEYKFPIDSAFDRIAAPTAQEIADQLPEEFSVMRDREGLRAFAPKTQVFYGPTLAEALAALYLKLHEATIKGQHPQEDGE